MSSVSPLSHTGPWQRGRDGGAGLSARGPRVAPGAYRVRVTVDDGSATEELVVVQDPRTREIGVTDADLVAQEALALQVRDLMSRAARMLAAVESELEDATGEEMERLTSLHRQLTERDDISYPQPMLVEQIGYLYGMVAGAAQRPGEDAYERYEQLVAETEAIAEELGW